MAKLIGSLLKVIFANVRKIIEKETPAATSQRSLLSRHSLEKELNEISCATYYLSM
jgi:hypothetical protein